MGMVAILVNGPGHFSNFFIPPTLGGSIWDLSKIGSVASEEKSFENVNRQMDARKDGRMTDEKWSQ